MAGRPAKAYMQIVREGRAHRTKAELDLRKMHEDAALSKQPIKCTILKKDDPVAYKEFKRQEVLLKKIEKNDALYQNVVTRYCLVISECAEFENKIAAADKVGVELDKQYSNGQIETLSYFELKSKFNNQYLALDRQLMEKRKMLLSIEKEILATPASVLRAIPKAPPKKGKEPDGAELF